MKGTKFWLAVGIIAAFLFVLILLALRSRLDAVLAGILVGGVTGVKGIFDAANTANNKAALAAGKGANEEATRAAVAPAVDVLSLASRATGSDIDAIIQRDLDGVVDGMRGRADEARGAIERAGDAARARLRATTQDLSGGSGG